MTEPAIPPPSRASWILVGLAVVVLAGLAVAYWWVGQSTPTDDTSAPTEPRDEAPENDAPPSLPD